MIAGAIILTAIVAAAYAAARNGDGLLPWSLWTAFAGASALGVAVGARRWAMRVGSPVHQVSIDESAAVSMGRLGDDVPPRAVEISPATMVWPGFAVLSLRPAQGAARWSRALAIPVMRIELDPREAWRLQRFLLWAQRDGVDATGSSHKECRG